jgi:class 3 adenylate cyclase
VQTRYAKVGGSHVAYVEFGEGPVDFLLFMGEYIPVDAIDEEPRYSRSLRRLGSMGRVIAFNRRGVGLSDPPDGALTLEQHVEDGVAVLDDLGVERAVAFGWNVGGTATMFFAADHAERTSALILAQTQARIVEAPDYPIGLPASAIATTADMTTATDQEGQFDFLTTFAPSVAQDERFRAWWVQVGNRGASPGRSRELWEVFIQSDARAALPRISAPTLVLTRVSGLGVPMSRYLADHIRDAKLVELPGGDLMWWLGESDAFLDEIEVFLGGQTSAASRPKRKLATVLFCDLVGSTERAASMGDKRWRETLGTYHNLAQREVDRLNGERISTAGDGVLATFDMPADAIRCGQRIAGNVQALGIDVRVGVHTGEIEIVGDDVAGIGVHIASRVMSAAGPGEVLVSRTVADLVTGSGLTFDDRGKHELKGVPGSWRLFAVTEQQ